MGTIEKTKWAIDAAHSEILFKVKHLVITTLSGKFDKFEGSMSSSSGDFSDADIEFSADVNSINTNQADRDGHLKSLEFLMLPITQKSYSNPKLSKKTQVLIIC